MNLNSTGSLTDADRAMFNRIGVDSKLLASAGIERVADREAREYGIKGSGDMSGIVYPYMDPRTGRRVTARVRRDNPEIEDGQTKRKYVSAFGDRRHLYFPPGCRELLQDPSIPIILVEAEKSALALTAFAQRVGKKYLPVAMGGCWGWRGRIGKVENSRGQRVDEMGPVPDLACVSSGRRVIILLDANASSNPEVQKAERALRLQLIKQGAGVSVGKLPNTESVNGPDDYIGFAGDDAMANVLDAASENANGDRLDCQRMAKGQALSLLLELGSDIEFFHTSDRDAFGSVNLGDHWETFPIAGRDFAHVLLHRFYSFTSEAPSKQALEDAVRIFTCRALFEGTERSVFLRIAECDGKTYLDLSDPGWNAVEISDRGWKILANPPVKFLRPRGMRPLPTPVAGGDINQLRSFLNVTDQEWPLILTWILAAYRRRGPFPMLSLNGEQGSCKSSASAVLRNLVDPNAASLRSSPRDERDLFITANNSWVITLDNLSHLPDWLSDALCRLATGGGLATRQLYTDLNEIIINVQRPIVLNGIAELATRGDLLDRSITISLPTLDPDKRRDEAEFQSAFESAKPQLFGALLDALVAALAQLPHVRLARKPRMADFAMFGVAVERALGWPRDTFIRAYDSNRSAANSSAIEASPIALAVQTLVAKEGVFEGTATELLGKLHLYVDEQAQKHRAWPDSGWKLSGTLRRLAPSLRGSGVEITLGERKPDHKRTRIIRIAPRASSASSASDIAATQPRLRTHSDAAAVPLDEASQLYPSSTVSDVSVVDAPDAADALVHTSMVRGEI